VVLVVAADDGIMPQTVEAINHAKSAGVPMIVAINKMDKEEANPQKVRERLLEQEVIVEAMSGDVQDVEISALKGTGLDELLEKIALQAELMELKANPDRPAEATVIEAQLDKGRGPVASVLVTRGTLKKGDALVAGTMSGRVRAIVNDQGKQIKEAGPSMPVEVLGLGGVPNAGDQLAVVENEQRAREVAEYRQDKANEARTALAPTNFDAMFSSLANKAIEFPLLVRADVQGSVEAIKTALTNLSNDDIKVRILHSGVGAITENDVTLAAAGGAPIIGFNVRPNAKARQQIEREKVRLMYYDVIYHLTEEIAKEMAGELGPERIEHVVGRAAVKEVFKSGKKDKAAGLLVEEGTIRKGLYARLTRDDVIVSSTTIASLRRFKDDVDEVRAGLECGVVLAAASKAPIIGFNVRPNAKARELVKRDGVRMMYYDVIYHLTEEVAKEMAGELGPERIETVVGRAEVKEAFKSGKRDKAAGLLVLEGVIRTGLFARLTREDVIVSATTIASLRRFKDDVDEVRSGLECGVVLQDTNDIKSGDSLEVFEVELRERTL